ncbi:hypothetical protein ACOSP7_013286 [Xanthoceras sorbifolium]
MIPAESIANMYRRATFNSEQNEDLLAASLDLIEERRDAARLRVAVYKQMVVRYYNRKVKPRHFKKGDLVLMLLLPGARNPQEGALGPNWECPYIVDEDLGNGAYHLMNVNGARVPHAWNAKHLCKYYQ